MTLTLTAAAILPPPLHLAYGTRTCAAVPPAEPGARGGWLYVSDLGLSEEAGNTTVLAAPRQVVGTPGWVAPEQQPGGVYHVQPKAVSSRRQALWSYRDLD